jgi:hypothetical protein
MSQKVLKASSEVLLPLEASFMLFEVSLKANKLAARNKSLTA